MSAAITQKLFPAMAENLVNIKIILTNSGSEVVGIWIPFSMLNKTSSIPNLFMLLVEHVLIGGNFGLFEDLFENVHVSVILQIHIIIISIYR